mmetsp:Transcript_13018/g.26022  ORF Transcript_13018/g.26022 Transcript_13018/m.26022 type:complete len:865 (-) Transcript_13018:1030-3624(-)|eukprot:CAMPEP_0118803630 /NCGR_PEP_ID=MMETSP1161-20130426/18257_1 /TAXON_ID=249345 /ORGANISM="Picochlorum oklahomensis, Strain CCMP2329" /LENGTH=864 /DNA_ID=CAMNT_0006732175 /DNA_START=237 /DNA_END=2831 /DNA_ORIENTATION=+
MGSMRSLQNGFARDITVYESPQWYYIVGSVSVELGGLPLSPEGDREESLVRWKVLKIEKGYENGMNVVEDEKMYTRTELDATLRILHALNRGRLACIAGPCPALLGVFQLSSELYYLLLATKIRSCGGIQGCEVYGIDGTTLLPLDDGKGNLSTSLSKDAEGRRLLSLVNLTSDFYFSFTWETWSTVQERIMGHEQCGFDKAFESDRVWNSHLTRSLRDAIGTNIWAVPLIQGFWEQETVVMMGQKLNLTLIGRRSCKFAGTRYLKRGVNEEGHVANDVEVEQIVELFGVERNSSISSIVQRRGSVPLFWKQSWSSKDPSLAVKPVIRLLNFLDPFSEATKSHFDQLREKYGNPVICLNLCQSKRGKGKEHLLSDSYQKAIFSLNASGQKDKVELYHWDMRSAFRKNGSSMLKSLQSFQSPLLQKTGIFAVSKYSMRVQTGVLRTNCVDCVDRTNVAQFSFGLLALGEQLHALGVAPAHALDPRSSMAGVLMRLYETMGDALGNQYGGSEAHSGFFAKWKGGWAATRQSKDFITTLRRFYSNAMTDEEKQHAIDYFLGQSGVFIGRTFNEEEEFRSRDTRESDELQRDSSDGMEEEEESCTPERRKSAVNEGEDQEDDNVSLTRLVSKTSDGNATPRDEMPVSLERPSAQPLPCSDRWKKTLFTKFGMNNRETAQHSVHLESLDDITKGIKTVRITASVPSSPPSFSWLTPRRISTNPPNINTMKLKSGSDPDLKAAIPSLNLEEISHFSMDKKNHPRGTNSCRHDGPNQPLSARSAPDAWQDDWQKPRRTSGLWGGDMMFPPKSSPFGGENVKPASYWSSNVQDTIDTILVKPKGPSPVLVLTPDQYDAEIQKMKPKLEFSIG